MFNVLIDTCVWLDLAQDSKQVLLLLAVENMVEDKTLSLIVPRVVYDEFQKNRERVAKAGARSLAGHIQQVKEAVKKGEADTRRRRALLARLDDVNHRIPLIGGAAEGVLERIGQLFKEATILETSDAVKLRAADRALNRQVPCHRDNKNSMADAIVIETYFEAVKAGKSGERFAFVTHNKSDFSVLNGDQRIPHPGLSTGFSKIRSLYCVNLAELLRRIQPSLVAELIWQNTWEQEPRTLSELLQAHEVLWRQVWYNHHKYREWMIEQGKIKVMPRDEWEKGKRDNQKQIVKEIWQGALRAAKKVERELGKDNCGPWTDFEWGMINGKLSAIRWALGDEWDMLDT